MSKLAAGARPTTLPMGTPPRGFNREQSAEYIGVWDRLQLDSVFAALPDEDGRGDVWSRIAV